ncbi:phage tail protein [Thauera butanivorans]|uniref:phage tail protein n=1 Tax=Thauera butanivorans TaxID=86174 RepID=UPI003AB6C102
MGSGKKVTIGYKYYMGIHMGLCRGPINALVAIDAGGKRAWEGSVTASGTVSINKPGLFGGDKKEGGVDGTLHVMMGEPAQTAPAPLATMLGGDVPGFRGMCTLFFDGLVSAMTPYVKPWKMRIRRSTAGWDGPAWYPERAVIQLVAGSIHSMNPAHIVYECLTNRQWSRGMPRDRINDASFRAAADRLYTEGFGLCLRWTRQESVSNFIQTVLDHIGGTLYQSRFDGLFHLTLVRDDYTVSALPLFDEDSGLLSIDDDDNAAASGATNEIIVQYHDPVSDQDRMWRERNLAAVHADGQILSQTLRYPGIPTAELAGRVAMRELRTRGGRVKRFKVRLDRRGYRINPGDAFRIRSLKRGIADMVVRAGRIEDGTLTSANITISVVQDIFGLPALAMSAPQPPNWVAPDSTPAAVVHRRLVELSWRDLAATTDPANLEIIDPTACRLAALAVRPTSMSLGYVLETRVGSGAWAEQDTGDWVASGLLVGALGRTTTAFALTAGADLDAVSVGALAQIGTELVRVATWNASTQSGTLARGCVDTVPAEHAAGARMWLVPDGIAIDGTDYAPSVTVQARLLTQTSSGTLAAALAGTDSLTMARRADRPYPPGRLRINGAAYPATVTGAVTVSWAHRDRKLQADQVIDTEQTSIGPEPGTTYRLRLYSGATLKRTYAGITGTSQTYTTEHETADGGPFNPLRIVLDSVRDGLYSSQAHDITVGRS